MFEDKIFIRRFIIWYVIIDKFINNLIYVLINLSYTIKLFLIFHLYFIEIFFIPYEGIWDHCQNN